MSVHFAPQAHAASFDRVGKACRIYGFGGPEVIRLEDVRLRTPVSREVLVRVAAAGVSLWDAAIRAGKAHDTQMLPLTLGGEFSGTVIETGSDVHNLREGTKVFGLVNNTFTGAYSDYALVASDRIARQPHWLSDVDAAAAPVAMAVAWESLFDGAYRKPTVDAIMILGGADPIGSWIIRLSKQLGLRVLATAGPDDVTFVGALGADEIIDPGAADLESLVRRAGFIVDCTGEPISQRVFTAVPRDKKIVCAAPMMGASASARRYARLRVPNVTRELLETMTRRMAADRRKIEVGAILPLASARLAHAMLERRRPAPRGKIVLQIAI